MTKLILNWPQALDAGIQISGGKGWNLARLNHFGFPIPSGFVISASSYRQLIDALPNPPSREQIRSTKLPDELCQSLRQALQDHQLENTPLAIRSSATLEDGKQHSFAGIHDSFLNIQGIEQIEQAICDCYASLWSERAISYREKMEIDDQQLDCAIVISQLINSHSAGIAFSCDPVSGRQDLITINANFGLGESVVSGAICPDHYQLDSQLQTIQHQELGSKTKCSVAPPGSQGTILLDSPEAEQQAVLAPQQLAQLGRLVMNIFHTLGEGELHQDIEWLYNGEQFLLTQARPVTTLPRYTLADLKQQDEVWTAGNFRDAVPMVMPTLSHCFASYHINQILPRNLDGSGYTVPEGLPFARSYRGRFYCNATLIQWLWYDATDTEPSLINTNLGGHHPEMEINHQQHRSPLKRLKRAMQAMRFVRHVNKLSAHSDDIFSEIEQFVADKMNLPITDMSDAELLSFYKEAEQRISDYDGTFIVLTSASGALFVVIQILEKKLAGEAPMVANALLAGGATITSAEQGYRTKQLAELLDQDQAAKSWLMADNYDPKPWTSLPETSPFRIAFAKMLDEFGHRAVYEIDLSSPRWHEDPSYLLNAIRNNYGSNSLEEIRTKQQQDATNAWQRINKLFGWPQRKLLRHFTRQARQGAATREMAKSNYVRLLNPLRRVIQEMSRRLCERQLLQQPEQVFHLTPWELQTLFSGEWDGQGLMARVTARTQRRAEWAALSPPDVIINDAPQKVSATFSDKGGKQLKGTAVAGGQAVAPAAVIHHPDQGHEMPASSILVCPSTDPGWTPLFLQASALVMETGGYLSHGAIVAREYGIPAVVNVAGVMSLINNGQTLQVDGDNGFVNLEEKA